MSATPNLKEEVTEGYDAFQKKIVELKTKFPGDLIVVLFTGSEGVDGKSWCPDCVVLEELLSKVLPGINPAGILFRVKVGDRDAWKSKDSPFRTDPKLKLTSIPTLMAWDTPKKLCDNQVTNASNIELIFEN